jgi:all-trans-8'-apo-beta-carotenal 15,15'-oxygenase
MTTPTLVDLAPGLEQAFLEPSLEDQYTVEGIEGTVPTFLRGTYYANGPGRFGRGAVRYRHWLDGDGMVRALRFDGDGVHFANRFVRGYKQVEEEAADRALYRTFGTRFAGDQLVRGMGLASPLNVSAVPWGGKLLALGEQGLPWALDPVTLESLGEYNFGGRLNPIAPFAAHAKVDPGSGELVNFGVFFASQKPYLNLYRFAPPAADQTVEQRLRRRLPLPYPCTMHDFAISEHHAIFYLSPYVLEMETLLTGATLMDSLVWKPELGSSLLIVRRADGEPVATVPLSPPGSTAQDGPAAAHVLHLINAFEAPDPEGDQLVVDVLELDQPIYDQYDNLPDLFPEARGARPVRRRIDLKTAHVREETTLSYDRLADFPQLDPRQLGRPYRRFWMLGIAQSDAPGRKMFDQLVSCNWETGATDLYQAPAGVYFASEPAFAPDPAYPAGSDQGAILCPIFQPDLSGEPKSAFWIFNALDLAAGPVAKVPLRSPIGFAFHACFETAALST